MRSLLAFWIGGACLVLTPTWVCGRGFLVITAGRGAFVVANWRGSSSVSGWRGVVPICP